MPDWTSGIGPNQFLGLGPAGYSLGRTLFGGQAREEADLQRLLQMTRPTYGTATQDVTTPEYTGRYTTGPVTNEPSIAGQVFPAAGPSYSPDRPERGGISPRMGDTGYPMASALDRSGQEAVAPEPTGYARREPIERVPLTGRETEPVTSQVQVPTYTPGRSIMDVVAENPRLLGYLQQYGKLGGKGLIDYLGEEQAQQQWQALAGGAQAPGAAQAPSTAPPQPTAPAPTGPEDPEVAALRNTLQGLTPMVQRLSRPEYAALAASPRGQEIFKNYREVLTAYNAAVRQAQEAEKTAREIQDDKSRRLYAMDEANKAEETGTPEGRRKAERLRAIAHSKDVNIEAALNSEFQLEQQEKTEEAKQKAEAAKAEAERQKPAEYGGTGYTLTRDASGNVIAATRIPGQPEKPLEYGGVGYTPKRDASGNVIAVEPIPGQPTKPIEIGGVGYTLRKDATGGDVLFPLPGQPIKAWYAGKTKEELIGISRDPNQPKAIQDEAAYIAKRLQDESEKTVAAGIPKPTAETEKLQNEHRNMLRTLTQAEEDVTAHPEFITGFNAYKWAQAYDAPDALKGTAAWLARFPQGYAEFRSNLDAFTAKRLNELAGSALTTGEIKRYAAFLPNVYQPPERFNANLKVAREYLISLIEYQKARQSGASEQQASDAVRAALESAYQRAVKQYGDPGLGGAGPPGTARSSDAAIRTLKIPAGVKRQ